MRTRGFRGGKGGNRQSPRDKQSEGASKGQATNLEHLSHMPKRARVDEADGAPEALTCAAKAVINEHAWDELRLAYRAGRLRFVEGVGAKATAEITLLLQTATAERSPWQRFMDL
eukprot:9217321-Pyramimonas_sp.AAC.1